MPGGALGRKYGDKEPIVTQGEPGTCMYVIQSGRVEVVHEGKGKTVRLAELGPEEFFGEMALFTREVRSATVRALGEAIVLTVDKRTLLARIQKDATLAFRIIEKMSGRIARMDKLYSRIRASDRRNWESRPDEEPQDKRV